MPFWRLYLQNRRRALVLVVAIMLVGAMAGVGTAFTLADSEVSSHQRLLDSFHHFAGQTPGVSPGQLFRQALQYDVLRTVGVLYLAGLSLVGAPLIVLIVFVRGFALGFAATVLVTPLSARGLLLGAAALLPPNILLVPAFIVAAVACLHFSAITLRALFSPRKEWASSGPEIPRQFVATTMMVLLAAGAAACADLVTAYVTPMVLALLSGWLH